MNTNYFIKIRGKANIPEPVSIGHNYVIVNDCSVTSEQRIDNNDGTFDVVYLAEPLTMTVQKDNGKVLKAKDPRKNSVKFRNYLYKVYIEGGYTHDFDTFYDEVILDAMRNMHALAESANKILDERLINSRN